MFIKTFNEFETRLKFEKRLKYGWFHLKSYALLQDLSRRSIETGFLADLRRGSNLLNSDSVRRTQILPGILELLFAAICVLKDVYF